jgi:AAA15 family ATPase/GTPase
MILEFSVKNFRSIKDLQTISFVATGLKSIDEEQDKNNIVDIDGQRILKTVGIYGANASGKSNILRALEVFCDTIGDPIHPTSKLLKIHLPFYYQSQPEETESFFQIILLIEGAKYRYGYTMKRDVIINEWLYGPATDNQTYYFIREGSKDNIKSNPEFFQEGISVPQLAYDHNLFLTHVASYENNIAKKIWDFIGLTYGNLSFWNKNMRYATLIGLEDDVIQKSVLNLLSKFGFNYDKATLTDSSDAFTKNQKVDILLTKMNSTGFSKQLNLDIDESSGTQKLFDIIGLLVFRFTRGGTAILDELDSNFHPALVIKLIQLFNDNTVNTGNAQLLFTSHDTNILDPKLMRRDQFYFTEKTEDDATLLYSLADLKGIRNDADFAKQYLAGFYGAVPILENYKAEPKDA